MAHSEARAWWADVQYLRDGYEHSDEARRSADDADMASRRALRERRGLDADLSIARPRSAHADPGGAARLAPDAQPAPRRAQHAESAALATHRANDPDQAAAPRRGAHVKGSGAPGRRTIEIRGRTMPAPDVPRSADVDRRRPQRRAVQRVGARPDRMAMWALLMGLLLILVAIGTADAPAIISLTLR